MCRGMLLAPSQPMSANASASRTPDETTAELVGGLLTDARDLASAHVDQLKLEVRAEVGSMTETITRTGIAIAAFVLVGLLLGQAAAFGLAAATGLPVWASFGLVGTAVAIAGLLVYRSRPRSVDLVPREAMAAIGRDVDRVVAAVDA